MVKHTHTIRRQKPTNCLSVFDHFAGLALKGLSYRNHKNFDESTFLKDLNKKTIITFDNQNPNRNYNVLNYLQKQNYHRWKKKKTELFNNYYTNIVEKSSGPKDSVHSRLSAAGLNLLPNFKKGRGLDRTSTSRGGLLGGKNI